LEHEDVPQVEAPVSARLTDVRPYPHDVRIPAKSTSFSGSDYFTVDGESAWNPGVAALVVKAKETKEAAKKKAIPRF